MRVTVQKEKLIRIIKRQFTYYTSEDIKNIIDEYGAAYFNGYSELDIEYIGFGLWKVTI